MRRIVAIGGGGLSMTPRGGRKLFEHVLALTGKEDPKVCYVGTAMGDHADYTVMFYDVLREMGLRGSHLQLFTMPNVADVTEHLLAHDVVYVGGGSVANLLAVWRAHGVDEAMRTAWENGVVLSGTSAGSLCWFEGGTTDSFGPQLRPLTNGLGFLPHSNTPHYDSELRRRPMYNAAVREGVVPPGWAADDWVGLVFEGTELSEAVTARDGAAAYRVEPDGETRVEPRPL